MSILGTEIGELETQLSTLSEEELLAGYKKAKEMPVGGGKQDSVNYRVKVYEKVISKRVSEMLLKDNN